MSLIINGAAAELKKNSLGKWSGWDLNSTSFSFIVAILLIDRLMWA
jgi:hypothetical protein